MSRLNKAISCFLAAFVCVAYSQPWNGQNNWDNRGGSSNWDNRGGSPSWDNNRGPQNRGSSDWDNNRGPPNRNNGPNWDNDRGPSNRINGPNNNNNNGGGWGGDRALANRLFYKDNGQLSAHCGTGTDYDWQSLTWTSGGIRPAYYENRGRARNINECMSICHRIASCYFATMTASSTCYTLSTSNPNTCRYIKSGHFGPMGERCTKAQPCPSGYKVCRKPNCALLSIMEGYCQKNDVYQGVSTCRAKIVIN